MPELPSIRRVADRVPGRCLKREVISTGVHSHKSPEIQDTRKDSRFMKTAEQRWAELTLKSDVSPQML